MIYDYTLENGKKPSWIEDGGYYKDPSNGKFIGYTTAGANAVDPSSTNYTKAQLITRVLNIHAIAGDEVILTNAEVTSEVEAWCSERGL
jgi:hypothetical protein